MVSFRVVRAHPRSRGENVGLDEAGHGVFGSSPLTRGKHTRREVTRDKHGLIPAHAGKTTPDRPSLSASWAHPRSRGENRARPGACRRRTGSSPLTRGKREVVAVISASGGLIPAHAGKTPGSRSTGLSAWAHPRSRGENEIEALLDPEQQGSSPLTRGKRARDRRAEGTRGLIPAHAGKTVMVRPLDWSAGAHPRSRGENMSPAVSPPVTMGSSPLTRGKLTSRRKNDQFPGLIPAHAGKTLPGTRPRGGRRAHPRSRGENFSATSTMRKRLGSSPLTRGKRELLSACLDNAGLIPAHAGKTSIRAIGKNGSRAHPRSRGENHRVGDLGGVGQGSSPLTRGKHLVERTPPYRQGLIPAHAGKTRPLGRVGAFPWAHPRSRGENQAVARLRVMVWGSSPLTRGKLVVGIACFIWVGLIPAHAGKTRSPPRHGRSGWAHPRSRGENYTRLSA